MMGCQLARVLSLSSTRPLPRGDAKFQTILLQNGNFTPRRLLVYAQLGETASKISSSAAIVEGKVERLKILMVAGGTGGHVYPAVAVADEIRNINETAHVEFVGTKDRLEWSAVPQAGYEISAIPAVALRRPLYSLENLLLPVKLLYALFSCLKLLNKIRPHVVVGTGGYVSGPLCLAAAISGYPVVIQEQNTYPGITNRLLGRIARTVFIAFSAATAYFPRDRCMLYGNPTRVELRQYVSAAVARRVFFPQEEHRKLDVEFSTSEPYSGKRKEKEVVLILGGSLGALTINEAVADMAIDFLEEKPERHIIWQTGPKYYEDMLQRIGRTHSRLAILPYVNAMHMAYAAADLVVARAGAITCSELLVTGKPSILVPSRNVAEDHQTKNAQAMAEGGYARMLPEDSLSSSALGSMIDELLSDHALLTEMMGKALKAAAPDAAKQIAEHILLLAYKQVPGIMA